MKVLLFFVGWLILLAVCWPLALVGLVLLPLIWLLSIPFRLLALVVNATLALLKTILFLPARMLGYRSGS